MEPIKIEMSVARVNPFAFMTDQGQNEGISFRFQEWEFRQDATLMLKSGGQPIEDAHKSPLYALQGLGVREMVVCEFELFQDRRQESRAGQRDSVKDVLGLRLKSVRPQDAANGKPAGAVSLSKSKS